MVPDSTVSIVLKCVTTEVCGAHYISLCFTAKVQLIILIALRFVNSSFHPHAARVAHVQRYLV